MSIGQKFDGQKPRIDLIPIEFIIGVAKAFNFGMQKYGEHNFRKGIPSSRLLSAALRHTFLEVARVKEDKESGLPHWALAGASLAMLAFMLKNRPELDDRYQYDSDSTETVHNLMYEEN